MKKIEKGTKMFSEPQNKNHEKGESKIVLGWQRRGTYGHIQEEKKSWEMPAQTRIKGDRRGRGERMKGFDDFLSPIQFEIPFISSRHLGPRERVKLRS